MTKVEELKEEFERVRIAVRQIYCVKGSEFCRPELEMVFNLLPKTPELIEAVREEKEADINNKLTPLINIVAMLNDGLEDGTISIAGQAQKVDIIKSEIDRANNFNPTS